MAASILPVFFIVISGFLVDVGFSQNPLPYRVYEEMPQNTLIGNTAIDAGLHKIYNVSELQQLRFDFLSPAAEGYQYFTVEKTTGLLHTVQSIDREEICAQKLQCVINLDIIVQPNNYFRIIKVNVTILDINDNAPTFSPGTIERYLSETSPPGTLFPINSAEDPDSGAYGIQKYRLTPSSSPFRLEVTNTSDGSVDVHLVLKEKLDREVEDTYNVKVLAYDGGSPVKSGSVEVTVNVLDANDNNPVFDNATYFVSVPEDTEVFTSIVQVQAHDPDIGTNGIVYYSFSTPTQQAHGNLFAINNMTGEIYLASKLSFEDGDTYFLTVMAKDKGTTSLPAYAKVEVHVIDVNDHAPVIVVNTLTNTDQAHIMEGAATDTFVAHILVTDPDQGKNGEVQCFIDNSYFKLVPMFEKEYKMVSATVFDRESEEELHLNIMCQDGGDPSQTSMKPVAVRVLDYNDHAPHFSQPVYRQTIVENNRLHATIIQVNATDKDAGENAAIIYSITGAPKEKDYLSIHPSTGVVTANVVFDFELKREYEFTIEARDQGEPVLKDTTVLILSITDENDDAPVFEQDVYSFGTYENQNVGTEIGIIRASDKSPSPSIRYSLSLEIQDASYFNIDAVSGLLVNRQILDRERQSYYNFLVIARNEGYSNMSATVNVSVYVIDENDNPPTFIFPSKVNNTMQVPITSPVGKGLAKVIAQDQDDGDNGDIMYSINGGNDLGIFHIDSKTGVVMINKGLSEFKSNEYGLYIVARDRGNPPLSAYNELHIAVNRTAAEGKSSGFILFLDETTTIIVVAIVAAAVVFSCLLICAIILVRRRQKNRKAKHRVEAQKMLQLHDSSSRESLEMMDRMPCSNPEAKNLSKQELGDKFAVWQTMGDDHIIIENPQAQNPGMFHGARSNDYVTMESLRSKHNTHGTRYNGKTRPAILPNSNIQHIYGFDTKIGGDRDSVRSNTDQDSGCGQSSEDGDTSFNKSYSPAQPEDIMNQAVHAGSLNIDKKKQPHLRVKYVPKQNKALGLHNSRYKDTFGRANPSFQPGAANYYARQHLRRVPSDSHSEPLQPRQTPTPTNSDIQQPSFLRSNSLQHYTEPPASQSHYRKLVSPQYSISPGPSTPDVMEVNGWDPSIQPLGTSSLKQNDTRGQYCDQASRHLQHGMMGNFVPEKRNHRQQLQMIADAHNCLTDDEASSMTSRSAASYHVDSEDDHHIEIHEIKKDGQKPDKYIVV